MGVDDDLVELADWLSDINTTLADRFLDSTEQTLRWLVEFPGVGSPKSFDSHELGDVRTWFVKGFPNHLIYYQIVTDGIEVLAILHGARDAEPILRRRVR
jgi:toxin ParE1/3/4